MGLWNILSSTVSIRPASQTSFTTFWSFRRYSNDTSFYCHNVWRSSWLFCPSLISSFTFSLWFIIACHLSSNTDQAVVSANRFPLNRHFCFFENCTPISLHSDRLTLNLSHSLVLWRPFACAAKHYVIKFGMLSEVDVKQQKLRKFMEPCSSASLWHFATPLTEARDVAQVVLSMV